MLFNIMKNIQRKCFHDSFFQRLNNNRFFTLCEINEGKFLELLYADEIRNEI